MKFYTKIFTDNLNIRLLSFVLFLLFNFYGKAQAQKNNKEDHYRMVAIPDNVKKQVAEQERLNGHSANTAELNSTTGAAKEETNNTPKQRDKNRVAATLPRFLTKEDSARIAKKRAEYLLNLKNTDNSKSMKKHLYILNFFIVLFFAFVKKTAGETYLTVPTGLTTIAASANDDGVF